MTRCPSHPGLAIAEIIEHIGRPKHEIAAEIGISPERLRAILAARKPVTPVLSLKFGKLFGADGEIWARMQLAHDLWVAAQEA
ncbi:MAG: HigA family addiction module antitoxin [Beijerinckiaceae bacterium]